MTDTTAGEGMYALGDYITRAERLDRGDGLFNTNLGVGGTYVGPHGNVGVEWTRDDTERSHFSPWALMRRATRKTLAAQPSAGAQGEARLEAVDARLAAQPPAGAQPVGVVQGIKADLYDTRLPDGTLLYVTPAQPDTGDVAALRSILARYPSIRLHAALKKLAALSKPNAPAHTGLKPETLSYCYALLGAARWSEAMDIWQASPEARAAAHADIQAFSKANAPGREG